MILDDRMNVYGGQAVIEGVMMRGKSVMAVAVRNPNGNIELIRKELSGPLRGRLAEAPFIRGVVGLVDAFGLGIRSLMYSASVAEGEEAEYEAPLEWGSILISLGIGIGIFFVLPSLMVEAGESVLGISGLGLNVIEGLVRLGLLVGYVWAIGLLPDVDRLYGYHGAEHKTINAYESDAELTPGTVASFPKEHPRCGTGFLLVVVVFSVLIFSALGPMALLWKIVSRLCLLPILAAISYEYIRYTAKHINNPIIRILIIPSMALQRLTTREPDEDMLAVAISAFVTMQSAEAKQIVSVKQ
ncbi:MAG: hypothetical protein CL789_01835 [Chloroflexi bacterium]|nr:hypothetical protein [Chloroflexota bacterium]HCU79822.1 DUF1385 domain-containing protein [Chloroflexota bacterium]|tara:strand:+ start:803 stop:1702 length:900 start_codon:yes stop_codon:yes gene_type:complete